MARTFREIQADLDRASARFQRTRDPKERRSLLKDMKRLVMECQHLTRAPSLDVHGPAIRAAGLVGEPDELALAALEKLARRNGPRNHRKP
jgi:hypothetical protein